MRRLLSFVVTMVFAVSCVNIDTQDYELDYEPDHTPSQQTTLIYFAGTDLKSYFNMNISDAEAAVAAGALGDNGSLFYLYSSSSTEATLYEMVKVGDVCSVVERKSYSDFVSLSSDSISQVLADLKSITEYSEGSGRVMNLIMGGHGFGWRLKSTTGTTAMARSGVDGEYEVEVDGIEGQEIPTRYMGCAKDGYIDISEFCEALDEGGAKFGYMLFDECFMASIEVLYRLRSYSDYIVASPCEILAAGFPYEDVLPALFTDNGKSYDLEGACEAFYDFYMNDYSVHCGCVSMCVTSELDGLVSIYKDMTLGSVASSNVQAYEGYSSHLFYDFGHYVYLAAQESNEWELFDAQFERAFPSSCRLNTAQYYTNLGSTGSKSISYYSGVTTSQISTNSYSTGWDGEPWAIDAGRVGQ